MKSLDVSQDQRVVKCYHCGNETLMNKVGSHNVKSNIDFWFYYDYELFACPICDNVTLHETYGDETMHEYDHLGEESNYPSKKILYPKNSVDSKGIPQKIKDSFEATLKIRNIDINACLMSLRRTLELILVDKGATKWGLQDKIEEIAEKGILPEVLKDASALAKKFGNDAAHGNDHDIDSHSILSLIEFVEYMLDYLYVLPYKMKLFEKRMKSQEEFSKWKNLDLSQLTSQQQT